MTPPDPALPHPLTPAGLARLTRSRRPHTLSAGEVYTYALAAAVFIAVLASAAQSLAAPLVAALTALPAGTVAEAVVASPFPVLQSVLISACGLLVLSWLLTRLGPLGLPEPVRVWLFQHPGFSPSWLRRRLSAVILGGVLGGIIIGLLAPSSSSACRRACSARRSTLSISATGCCGRRSRHWRCLPSPHRWATSPVRSCMLQRAV